MKHTISLPSYDEISKYINYNPDNGELRWIFHYSKIHQNLVGSLCGSPSNTGHIGIKYRYVLYKAHRIAWLLYYKEPPSIGMVIDHINGNPKDNRIANLRLVTQQQNCFNRNIRKSTKSNKIGINFHNKTGKWRARIGINGKRISLGLFDSMEDAVKARETASIKYFGEYSNV